jgi:O-acetyl-ADP-ribose deacetylase (regulator of RNase III)
MTAMLLAKDNGCKSIGFPLISSGIFGYPKREAWEVALRAVDDTQLDMEVYFAVLDDGMLELGNQVYKDLLG